MLFFSEVKLIGYEQILYDGAKELAQNESGSSKYVVSIENKVCLCLVLNCLLTLHTQPTCIKPLKQEPE